MSRVQFWVAIAVIAAAGVLATIIACYAADTEHNVQFDYSYDLAANPSVIGYRIYKHGVTLPIADITDKNLMTTRVKTGLSKAGTTFTMTAYSAKGESLQSAGFTLEAPPDSPLIKKVVVYWELEMTVPVK